MRYTIVLAGVLTATVAHAQPTTEQFKVCEAKYRVHWKELKAASPAGYVPAPDKDRKPTFMINCLAAS